MDSTAVVFANLIEQTSRTTKAVNAPLSIQQSQINDEFLLKSIQNSSVLSSVIPFPLIFFRFFVFLFLCTSFSLFFWPFLWLIMPRCLRASVLSCLRAFVHWCLYAFSHSSLHPFVSSSLKAFCAFVAWSFASLILSYFTRPQLYIQQLYFL